MITLGLHKVGDIGKIPSSPQIPLSERVAAWWHGRSPQVTDLHGNSSPRHNPGTRHEDELLAIREDGKWGPVRRSVLEALWGEGFIEPGGESFAHQTLAPLTVDSTRTVLDLNAGLGGNARLMAKEHNLWMEAFEADPELAKTAHRISEKYGLAAQAPITHMGLQNLNLREDRYDAIYSRESLFTCDNKEEILKKCALALKPGAQFLITDFTCLDDKSRDEDQRHWMRDADKAPHFWTIERYLSEFQELEFSIRSNLDLTQSYVEQINHGWSKIALALQNGEYGRENTNMLMNEGEIWLKRAQDLSSGKNAVTRFFAILNKKAEIR